MFAHQPQYISQQQQQQQAVLAQQQQHAIAYAAAAAAAAAAAPRPPSFADRMWARRREIVKLVVLSMVVLLAVSSHWSIAHYIKIYVEQLPYANSVWVEAAIRAAYPVAILLVIWILKTPFSNKGTGSSAAQQDATVDGQQ